MLSGLTVVEIGQNIAGPYAGTIFADLGAEVIKVEKPEGDDARGWTVSHRGERVPLAFASLNRGKKSVVVDFKDSADMARFKAFLGGVDVLIHNLRPGLAEELGLGGEDLLKLNPRLVYCGVGAFGHAGPLKHKPGYEPLGHAFSGIMALNGEPDGEPLRTGPSIVDPGTGMWTAIGALAALRRRDQTGKGCIVNTSLLETALIWVQQAAINQMHTGREPARLGNASPTLAPYEVFRTATSTMMIAAGNDRLYRSLCRVLEHPEWIEDLRFRTNADRVANRAVLVGLIQEVLLQKPQAEWCALLDRASVPNAPIHKVSEAVAHPQVKALDIIQTQPGTGYRLLALPVAFDGRRRPLAGPMPALGEHTEAVLGEGPAKRAAQGD